MLLLNYTFENNSVCVTLGDFMLENAKDSE